VWCRCVHPAFRQAGAGTQDFAGISNMTSWRSQIINGMHTVICQKVEWRLFVAGNNVMKKFLVNLLCLEKNLLVFDYRHVIFGCGLGD